MLIFMAVGISSFLNVKQSSFYFDEKMQGDFKALPILIQELRQDAFGVCCNPNVHYKWHKGQMHRRACVEQHLL